MGPIVETGGQEPPTGPSPATLAIDAIDEPIGCVGGGGGGGAMAAAITGAAANADRADETGGSRTIFRWVRM